MKKRFLFIIFFAQITLQFVNAQSLALGKSINISNNDSFAGFEMLDTNIQNCRLILSGENHSYTNTNISVKTKLFRYLVKNKGVKHLLIEQGYSLGQMLNIYMTTGDTLIMNKLEKCTDISFFRFYKNLRSFYVTLPDSQKFTIQCIDVERFFHRAVNYMEYLLPKDKAVPEDLSLDIESLHSLEAYINRERADNYRSTKEEPAGLDPNADFNYESYTQEEKTLNLLMRSFDSLNSIYRNYLGVNYDEYARVLKSLKEKAYYESLQNASQQVVFREQFIYKSFEKVANAHPNDKFYGQFGRCHVTDTSIFTECDWYDVSSFINRVNRSKQFTVPCKAFGIGLAYANSYYEYNNNFQTRPTYANQLKNYVKAVNENESMLFPVYNDTANDFLKNRFQYVLVSKAVIDEIPVEGDTTVEVPLKKKKKHVDYYNVKLFSVSYAQTQLNFKQLNESFGKNIFNSPIEIIGLDFVNCVKEDELSVGVWISKVLPKTGVLSSDTSFQLKGFNFGLSLGYDLLQKAKKIAILPSFGLGFQNLKLSTQVKNNQFNFPNSSSHATDVYKSPAFIVTPQLDVRLHLFASFWLGAKAGYCFDIGNKQWTLNGQRRETGANLNQGGMFFQVMFGGGYKE